MEPKVKNQTMERGLGRRKTAAARVRLSSGTGKFTVNSRELNDYFGLELLRKTARGPLAAVGREKNYDVSVKVVGGGISGQAAAIAHGIARALLSWDPDLRPVLRAEGFLTRDPRAKERKKFGKHRARRGHQWRKR